ncbi:MAG: hypothetical protein HFG80_06945 [Eubacterium sp.]|nr:hypothetical protein [Eubacterium sp.]
MEYTNDFYAELVAEVSPELFEKLFMEEIRTFIEDKMHVAMGKMLSSDPLSEDEFLKILQKGMGDDAFNRRIILARIHDFSASCKIKNASNKWVVDYFYLSCLKQLLLVKKVERVHKSQQFEEYLAQTVEWIDKWLEQMSIPVERKFFLLRSKTEDVKEEINFIDADELYPEMIDITRQVFIIYHSLSVGLEKERDDVTYAYEIVEDEIDFAEIGPLEKKDALKAAKIQKDQTAANLFENLLTLYYLEICH